MFNLVNPLVFYAKFKFFIKGVIAIKTWLNTEIVMFCERKFWKDQVAIKVQFKKITVALQCLVFYYYSHSFTKVLFCSYCVIFVYFLGNVHANFLVLKQLLRLQKVSFNYGVALCHCTTQNKGKSSSLLTSGLIGEWYG